MGLLPLEQTALEFANSNFGIRRIYVEKLFGEYTYQLFTKDNASSGPPKLMILYGDNGSGKTTILDIVFNLLSHVDLRGHKSALLKRPFKKVVVELGDDVEISATRAHAGERAYRACFRRDGKTLAECNYGVESENLEERISNEREHKAFLDALASLNQRLYLLTDDRKIATNTPPEKESDDVVLLSGRRLSAAELERRQAKTFNLVALDRAVEQVSSWTAQQAFRGSSQGEDDVNSIYVRMIEGLAAAHDESGAAESNVDELAEALETQAKRSTEFEKFGLARVPRVDPIIALMRSSPGGTRDVIARVVRPYVDGLKARLDALEDVRTRIAAFVDSINSFYSNKRVFLDVRKGMIIRSRSGDRIAPQMLSSGERQLLFLLSSTVIAREQPSVFMIDEPELSLNVKWQRQLLTSLLALTRNAQTQFILATHSIELLTRHRQFVVELKSSE